MLTAAAPPSFFTKIRRKLMGPPRDYNLLIGQTLKQYGVITERQLQQALYIQKERKRQSKQPAHLGQILVELGYAKEKDVLEIIGRHYRLNIHSLSENIDELIRRRRRTFREKVVSFRLPIWLQLAVATMLITVVTVFSLSYFILNRQKEQLYQQSVKVGMLSLNHFTGNARISLLNEDVLRLNVLVKEASDVEGILYAFIVDNKGRIKAHTDLDQIDAPFAPVTPVENVTRKEDVTHFSYVSPSGAHILNLTRPIVFSGKELGQAHVGISLDFIEHMIAREKSSILILTTVIVCFCVVVAVFLGLSFSRPISALVAATQEIGKGNYQHKVRLIRNDELGNLADAFNQMSWELWMKSLMQESMGKYVGPEVVNMIMANPENSWLKGLRCEATILLADVRNFTSYAEANEPEVVVEALNEYFDIVTRVSLQYGGYIDKFIGDGVLVIFGVPIPHANHVKRAVKTALHMQIALRNAGLDGNPVLSAIGISINTGVVVSGNIGSQVKMEYTVIGDSVNLTARLNHLAGPGEIIISRDVYDRLDGQGIVEALPPQTIKGKTEPVDAFRLKSISPDDIRLGDA